MRKKPLYILMLVVVISLFSTGAFAQGEAPEGPTPPAFTGTVFALSFLFVLGLGGIVLYASSKGQPEQAVKGAKNASRNATSTTISSSQKISVEKKKLRKKLLAGEIDEKIYLEEIKILQ